MTVISSHDRADNRSTGDSNKKEAIIHLDLLVNGHARLVVRCVVTKNYLPQRDDLAAMNSVRIRDNRYGIHTLSRLNLIRHHTSPPCLVTPSCASESPPRHSMRTTVSDLTYALTSPLL